MCGETKISAKYNLSCDNKCFCEKIIDHLIDNGVTIQKWISAKDMLPEISEGWTETPEPVMK